MTDPGTFVAQATDGLIEVITSLRQAGHVFDVKATVATFLGLFPGHVFTRDELRLLSAIADDDADDLIVAIPAENVPAEISGAWFELRLSSPLLENVQAYLAA